MDANEIWCGCTYGLFARTLLYKAANVVDSSPVPAPLSLRVEPKSKSGIRQQDLLKTVLEIKPKRPKMSSPSEENQSSTDVTETSKHKVNELNQEERSSQLLPNEEASEKANDTAKSLLGLAYESSDSED
ncbi:N-acetyltransferase eco [Bienertia sinuspersici]